MERLTIVSLGPDKALHLTLEAAEALRAAPSVLLRTARHGVCAWLSQNGIAFASLDSLYESLEDFDTLNAAAADRVMEILSSGKPLCYAVPDPGSDATVALLRERGVPMRILPGVTQPDVARADALTNGFPAVSRLQTAAAVDFAAAAIDPSAPLLVTELNSRLLAGETKLHLLDVYAPETRVLFSGNPIALSRLDRQAGYDHLSYVYIGQSPMTERARFTFTDLLEVMARLRRPGDGCPWDREQTHRTLREYLIEEAYEAVDAIDSGDPWRMADELGDVLLQVVFHAEVAKEHGEFTISDITTAICHKMITRHAHIFGDVKCETAEDVLKSWESIKKQEKGQKTTAEGMRDLPGYLPALMRASKVQKKAKQAGFDWDTAEEALAKVHEEAGEVAMELQNGRDPEAELGDLLFAAVNASRLAGVQPEVALSGATEKFIRRYERMEAAILAEGKQPKDMSLSEMDVYWEKAKRLEKEGV